MSSKKTGESRMKFDYWEEFEELFGKEQNVVNPHTAASATSAYNEKSAAPLELPPPKKQKKTILEKQLATYNDSLKVRAEGREKRHQEKMERQDKALEILQQIATTFKNCQHK